MANLDYYGFEVNDILKQAENDHESIGMVQVNVLPIPDGILKEYDNLNEYGHYDENENLIINPPKQYTITGNRELGKVTFDIRGYNSSDHDAFLTARKLTPTGSESDADGKIQPGKYQVSFTNTGYNTDYVYDAQMMVTVAFEDDSRSHWVQVNEGETKQITVEEDFTVVQIIFRTDLKVFGKTPGPNERDMTDLDTYRTTFDMFPFIRRVSMGDAPFEPYKPDLQTQIDELSDSNEDLTEQVAQNTSISAANKAATLLNADLIGVFPSYQLFPLDKGTIEAPNEIDKTVCKFVTLSEFANHSTIPPCLICVGQTDDTTLTEGEFSVGFNFDYKTSRGFDLLGDILPGTYQFSMEIFDDSGFTNVGVLYATVYEYVDSEYVELCRVEAGGSGTFTVSEAYPFVKIVITTQRFAGSSWNDKWITVKPYLRRIEFKDKPYGVYVPSFHKQIATMDLSGGYNETQTDTVTDSVEEVTQ